MRVHWNADRIIRRNGWDTLWYKASLPTETGFDGTQKWGTRPAEDRGYLYESPKTIKVLFTSVNQTENFDAAGSIEEGTARGTVRARRPVALNDKLIPQQFPVRRDFLKVRGDGSADTSRDIWLQQILAVRDSVTSYQPGTDFQLNKDKDSGSCEIEWLEGGRSPSEGSSYSVQAMVQPVWIVTDHPQVRALRGRQLPWLCQLSRYDGGVHRG